MDTAVVAAVIAAAASTVGAVLVYRASRLATNAGDRANRDSALLRWAEQLQASEGAARESERAAREEAQQSRERAERIKDEADAEVEEIRAQVASLKAELHKATEVATQLTDRLTMAQMEAWRPEPDVGALRRLLGRPGGGPNGRSL